MTNRPQILRSSVPGQIPTAGQRAPGELWTTFPDKQLGIIDTTKTAQPLIAVRFFSTTANYATGDFVVQAGQLYRAKASITAGAFNASQWTQIAGLSDIPAPYVLPIATPSILGGVMVDNSTIKVNGSGVLSAPLPIASTTVLGGVKVDGTTIAANGSGVISTIAASVQAMNDNRIINGDMRIDQRNGGAGGTAIGYTVDRWRFEASLATKGAWQQFGAGAPLIALGFGNNLNFTANSAYTPLAADFFCFSQRIEADMVSDFAWGTASAQSVTLSFLVASSLTGTFSGSIRNAANTRSYPFTYSVPISNTWTKIVITIPGDTGGTWVMSGNSSALWVAFDFGGGTTYRGPANAWAAANYVGVTGSVNIVATNGAAFNVTGVKLEIGSVATPYNRQSLAKSQADCERYFRWVSFNISFYAGVAGGAAGQAVAFAPQMRVAPTLSGAVADPNLTPQVINQASNGWAMITPYGAQPFATATAAGGVTVQGYRSQANAEL